MFFNYEIGDYLLHKKYGIARFLGIEYIICNQSGCDFIKLQYLNDVYIFIPVYNINVLKFHSNKNSNTQIEEIDKSKILKKTNKVKEEISKIAEELIEISILRDKKTVKIINLNCEYDQFCKSFPFNLTKSQQFAIKDIEKDLRSSKPMDRLLCGDVGFGKTEVAARALALCVTNDQKALFISPTTILALQHFNILKDRFKLINKRCELFSKLSDQDFKQDWLDGKIDVLISTIHHKYLDKLLIDDLGLVILDEEHHFGMKFKERIREKTNFLQLSATPIPRTLHLALSNIKDISTLDEPPYIKQVTEVSIVSYDDLNLKDLILKELEKKGKIFIVVPRIQFLDEIKKLLDFTDFVVLHGQLPKEEIKSIFSKFINGEICVMLATNIIESGVDIKDANLMIVFYAHMFGVAQLHQLKGRVGRGDRESKIYFVMPKILSDIAKDRLDLIKNNSNIGGGFNLSIQDMEKRGSGTVVGTKQSGKDYGFGLEMYYEMMSQALGKQVQNKQDKNIIWVNFGYAYIPNDYIKDEKTKLAFYKKLSAVLNFDDLDIIIEDLKNFGSIPEEVENYLLMIRFSILTQYFEIQKIVRRGDKFDIVFSNIKAEVLIKLVQSFKFDRNQFIDIEINQLKLIISYFIFQ